MDLYEVTTAGGVPPVRLPIRLHSYHRELAPTLYKILSIRIYLLHTQDKQSFKNYRTKDLELRIKIRCNVMNLHA